MFLTASSGSRAYASLGGFNTQILGNLSNISAQMQRTLQALSTGYRCNRAADDPAASVEIARTDSDLNNVATAISNNQLSFSRLSGIDGSQKAILSTLMEIRENAQNLQNSSSSSTRQTLMETIVSQLSALDTLANGSRLGGRKVLEGSQAITLGADSARALDARGTFVRSVRDNSPLRLSFSASDAAAQAEISGALALPTSDKSTFMVTTARGSKTIELAAGVSMEKALKQINSSLASIGARAEVYTDNGGNQKLSIISNGYGKDFSVRYDHLSGERLLDENMKNAAGKNGRIRINAASYALAGEYNNYAAEGAEIKGMVTAGAPLAATDLTFTTADGKADFTNFSAPTIADAIAALNADARMQNLGISAVMEKDNDDNTILKFSTRETGSGALLSVSDSNGTLFADGRKMAAASGRDYTPGEGLRVNYTTQEISASLSFQYDKVATASAAQGAAAPAGFSMTLEPHGGTTFQIGTGNGLYDSVTYGFRDLTSAGLGLNALTDSTSALYLMNNGNSALDFIDSAISEVEREYGALGAFMNYHLTSTNNAMEALQGSLSDSRGIIADADVAEETLKAVRLQILQSTSLSALAGSANFSQMMASLLPSNN